MSDGLEHEVVRVERPATGGGVGRLSDGRVVFVRDSLAGELVSVSITERTSSFARAVVRQVLEASSQRTSPPCHYAGAGGCGGCDLQHASTAAQIAWKRDVVTEQLRRIGGFDWPVVVTSATVPAQGSRTRLRCAVDAHGRLALRSARSHDLVAVNPCWLMSERAAEAFTTTWRNATEVEVRAIGDGPPFAVVRRVGGRAARLEVCSLDGSRLDPSPVSRVEVRGTHYEVSPASFWQSHVEAPEMLLDRVTRWAAVERGDRVVDLYSGVGLFAVSLAASVGPTGHVVAVESSPHAVRDARSNAQGHGALRVRESTVSPKLVANLVRPGDVVIVDPPRTGLARGVATAIAAQEPRRILYVSCDAATFARDLKVFLSARFSLSHLEILDLFPMTEHVELVSLLDFAP